MLNKLSFNLAKELNESETRKFKIKKKVFMEGTGVKIEELEPNKKDSNKLTEGAGAGYHITGTIDDSTVNSFNVVETTEDKYGTPTYLLDCDISATLEDVVFESYYDGGKVDSAQIQITKLCLTDNHDPEEKGELNNDNIKQSLDSTQVKSLIGAGWIHSTFDGNIEYEEDNADGSVYSDFYVLGVEYHFIDEELVKFIDLAVQGENITEEYIVYAEDYDELDRFDSEEEAIEYAKNTPNAVRVEQYSWRYNFDGDIDFDSEYSETVWEKDDMEESEKPLKEGFKLGEKAEIIDTCERRGQPIALVKLSKAGRYEYIVAFNYEVDDNDEVSWGYGYYYYDEESGKEAFEKVKAGGNLSESKEVLEESVFEIDYAHDSDDLSSEESVINSIKNWLGDLANNVNIEVVELHGPGSGWPVVRLTGDKEKIGNFLNKEYNSGAEDTVQDTIDLYMIKESEKTEKKPIVEAAETEVKDLQVIKEQGNIYMLEDKSEGTRYIVGENYNLSEGEIENAEIYDTKEEADKDYLNRCEITTTKESDK